MTHHKTWFPLIVIALSALLGLVIYSVFKDRLPSSERPNPVTAAAYETAVSQAVGGLSADLDGAVDTTASMNRLEKAREDLLALVVPTKEKDLHLEMVMTLSAWMTALRTGDQGKAQEAQERWQEILKANPWITAPAL